MTYGEECIKAIQSILSDDLLTSHYRKLKKEDVHPFSGHCYCATECLFHLLGGMESRYRPHRIRINDEIVHWYLMDRYSNVLDPTAEQFDFDIDYSMGRKCGFLTGNRCMCKRTFKLLSRLPFKFVQGFPPEFWKVYM